jgi:hypothetical protein
VDSGGSGESQVLGVRMAWLSLWKGGGAMIGHAKCRCKPGICTGADAKCTGVSLDAWRNGRLHAGQSKGVRDHG